MTAPLPSMVVTSSVTRDSGEVQELGGVGHPGSSVQVRLDVVGRDAVADHQGEREDPPGAVPDRPVRVVHEPLRTAQGGSEGGARVGGDGAVGGQDHPWGEVGHPLEEASAVVAASSPSTARFTQPTS